MNADDNEHWIKKRLDEEFRGFRLPTGDLGRRYERRRARSFVVAVAVPAGVAAVTALIVLAVPALTHEDSGPSPASVPTTPSTTPASPDQIVSDPTPVSPRHPPLSPGSTSGR